MIIAALAAAVLFLAAAQKQLKAHAAVFYLGTILVAAAALVFSRTSGGHVSFSLINEFFIRGELATALFLLVMYAPVLPKKWKLRRMIYSVRGELAIMACLLILVHNSSYGRTYFVRLFTRPESMPLTTLLAAAASLLMLLLMLPLCITSFRCVRRRMKAARWKWLQRWSYLFYGLMYLHLALLYYPQLSSGRPYVLLQSLLYTAIFGVYAVLRPGMYLKKKKPAVQPVYTHLAAAVTAFVLSILTAVFCMGHADTAGESSRFEAGETESEASANPSAQSEAGWTDGVYEGTASGYNGPMTISVTIENGEIAALNVVSFLDDPDYFSGAKSRIFASVLEKQTAEVDGVSGATYSSNGIINSVKDALEQAAQ